MWICMSENVEMFSLKFWPFVLKRFITPHLNHCILLVGLARMSIRIYNGLDPSRYQCI
jgi:hypothetical protein